MKRKRGSLTTQQIGKAGEVLLQYKLLKYGIESAPMTTDAGVDLVAYAPKLKQAVTIQVKTNLKPKRAGGKGAMQLDWWLRENSPAEFVALANLETDQIWIFTHKELVKHAQHRSATGRVHFYFYSDDTYMPRKSANQNHQRNFEKYKLENRVSQLFGTGH